MAPVVKNLPANAGNARDMGSISGWGRSPGEGSGNPLQDSCLENPMDGGAWWATVHGVTKNKIGWGDFPGGRVVKTLCCQCRGHGFEPWSGNKDPTSHSVQSEKKKKADKHPSAPGSVHSTFAQIGKFTPFSRRFTAICQKATRVYDDWRPCELCRAPLVLLSNVSLKARGWCTKVYISPDTRQHLSFLPQHTHTLHHTAACNSQAPFIRKPQSLLFAWPRQLPPEVSAFTGVPAWLACALCLFHSDIPAVPQICERRQISFSLPHFSVSPGMLIILGLSANHPCPSHPTAELLPNSDYSCFTPLNAPLSSMPLNPLTPIPGH